MNRPNGPDQAQFERALRLLAHELAAGGTAARAGPIAGRVYDKLAFQLVPLLGVGGVHMMFVRSATLVGGDFAFVVEVSQTEATGKLRECLHAQNPAVPAESAAALFGSFFVILTELVGERLTAQVLHNAWPGLEAAVSPRSKK